MDVTVLGPQRRTAAARAAVADLAPEGPIATINAGWREREGEAGELAEVLGGRMRHLPLFRRWQELVDADPAYAAEERRLTAELAELQEIYALRLRHAMAAAEEVGRRTRVASARTTATQDAVRALRDLDRWQLAEVADTREAFYRRVGLGERASVRRHRAELARATADASATVVAGGHVGVLLHLLHVFGLAGLIRAPVIAWSAGAMALSERVVLFHDHGPAGRRHPELYAEGLGAYAGVVPFPHPRRRLRLADPEQMSILVARLAPRRALLLADGERVDLRDGRIPAGARVLGPDGRVGEAADDHG